MTVESTLRTWTIYPDYGFDPIIWQKDGVADSRVGIFLLSSQELGEFLPHDVATEMAQWYSDWLAMDYVQSDWHRFYRHGLMLSSKLALWVADAGVIVRMSPNSEDMVASEAGDIWLNPQNVKRYSLGHVDQKEWNNLLRLWRRVNCGTVATSFKP